MKGQPVQVQPHSEEAERAVLGAILLKASLAPRILRRLQPEDFYVRANQAIAESIRDLVAEGVAVDMLTLKAHLEQTGRIAALPGVAEHGYSGLGYLATLDDVLPDLGRIDAYCDIVAERANRRRIIKLAHDVATAGHGADSVEDVIGRMQVALPQLLASTAAPKLKSLSEILPPFMLAVEDAGVEVLRGIPTGFADLDALTGGLRSGNLVVIAGRPGLGKTSLALNIAQHVALGRAGQPRPVGIWSLEMTNEELLLRLICSEANVASEALRAGYLSTKAWRRVGKAGRELEAAPLWVDDSSGLSCNQVESRIRRAVDDHGIELAVVDYLQLVGGREGGRRAENRNIEVGQVSSALKALAKDLRIPIVVLSQLSRETTKRAGNRPTLADLRESGSIEADADLVVFVHRDAAYDPEAEPGLAEAIVAKSRHSPTGSVSLAWIGETTTFRSLQRHEPPPIENSSSGFDDEGMPF